MGDERGLAPHSSKRRGQYKTTELPRIDLIDRERSSLRRRGSNCSTPIVYSPRASLSLSLEDVNARRVPRSRTMKSILVRRVSHEGSSARDAGGARRTRSQGPHTGVPPASLMTCVSLTHDTHERVYIYAGTLVPSGRDGTTSSAAVLQKTVPARRLSLEGVARRRTETKNVMIVHVASPGDVTALASR